MRVLISVRAADKYYSGTSVIIIHIKLLRSYLATYGACIENECKIQMCNTTPGLSWDGTICMNKSCWGECRVPKSTGCHEDHSDQELKIQFTKTMAKLMTDLKYAKWNNIGPWQLSSSDSYKYVCNKPCTECLKELEIKCDTCNLDTDGISCIDYCKSLT